MLFCAKPRTASPRFNCSKPRIIIAARVGDVLTCRDRWISPATDVLYEQYARSARVKPETVDLGYGAKGHWIGDKDAQNVLIWYHGKYFDCQTPFSAYADTE